MRSDGGVRIGFVGCGRLAASLSMALGQAGYTVEAVADRDGDAARRLAGRLGDTARPVGSPAEVAKASDLVFLAVQDSAIAEVAAGVSWEKRHFVVHCSGAVGLDALEPAAAAGATTGCLHPLQSFPSLEPEPELVQGIACGIEGHEPLGSLLAEIVTRVGARAFRLEGVNRPLYHAAAVFASNYAIALVGAAGRTWALAGLPAGLAREALAPLLASVVGNVARMELGEALTGPVARGDVRTVEAHLGSLAAEPSLEDLYRLLGRELLRLDGPADPAARERLRQLLGEVR